MLPDPLFLNVHMYGIMIAVGILFAFLVLFRYSKVLGLPGKLTDLVYYDGIVSILLGFGAAALFQATYNYIEHPENGFHLGEGITFLGGIIGGTVVYLVIWIIFRKKVPGSLFDIMPVIPCMITIGHAFGRIGCFFAGCCYGKPTACSSPGLTSSGSERSTRRSCTKRHSCSSCSACCRGCCSRRNSSTP